MKNLKKLFAVLLVVMMTMALTLPAMAAGTATITVNKAVAGKDVYAFLMFTKNGDSYQVTTEWADFIANADGKLDNYLSDIATEGSALIITGTNTAKYLKISNDDVKFAKLALEYADSKSLTATAKATVPTGASSVKFENLDLGYYLVYMDGAAEAPDSGTFSVVSLTHSGESEEINIKAKTPDIEKDETDEDGNKTDIKSADVGKTINYVIEGTVPDTTGYTKYTYKVTDTMTHLAYNKDIKVTINGNEVAVVDNPNVVYTESDNGFVIDIDMTKYQAIDEVSCVGEAVKITYSAKVTAAALETNTAENTADLTYSDNPKDESETDKTTPDTEYVNVSVVGIDKVDGSNQKPLDGAKFILLSNDEMSYYTVDADGNVTWKPATEKITAANHSTIAADAEVVTTVNGKAEFRGVEDGTYKLLEVKAPANYNLLTSAKPITVNSVKEENIIDGKYEENDGKTHIYKGYTETAKVENNSGSQLPETGGIGTTIFYVVGGLLMVGAAVLFVAKKRMAVEK